MVIERVKKPDGLKNHGVYWLCKCTCGNEKLVEGSHLRRKKIVSCGCYHNEIARQGLISGEARSNTLYTSYRWSARKRGIYFDLNKEDFLFLTKQNCFYCGAVPFQVLKQRHSTGEYVYNGIDRIDSSKGYTIDNVVTCCGRCNEAKWDTDQQDFLAWVERVYNHSIKTLDKNK